MADAELADLYRAAAVTAHPARYEGFGLTVLEALACASPVVAAATGALPEVVGDAGVLVAPDPGSIAEGLRAALEPATAARLREAGPERAARYSRGPWARRPGPPCARRPHEDRPDRDPRDPRGLLGRRDRRRAPGGRDSARGHGVTVYCRSHAVEHRSSHVGARLVHLPTIRDKYLDTIAHTAVSTAHMITRERPDAAVYFIGGNAPLVPLARLAGIPSVLQVDGLDSERAKWPAPARAYLRAVERLAPTAASVAITDSEAVADHMEARFGRRLMAIPYGADLPDPGDSGLCERLGVEPGRFILFVGRLVPENNAHLLVAAHSRLGRADWPLVVVGDAPYSKEYISGLKRAAGPEVRFPGYVFNPGYAELVHRAGVMCAPTEVGGTHPVVVDRWPRAPPCS